MQGVACCLHDSKKSAGAHGLRSVKKLADFTHRSIFQLFIPFCKTALTIDPAKS